VLVESIRPQNPEHPPTGESDLFIEEPTLSADGRALVYCRSHGGSSLWLLRIGPESEAG
jgi:hypothetical protein